MAEAPRFSITIPAYNAEATIAETVSSVLAQSFSDWELVIVDDGSSDGTRALAERLAAADERIHVISQPNRGPGGAYNTAVRAARADLLVMLSADDLLHPRHLSDMHDFIEANPDASVYTCGGWYEYPDGRREVVDIESRWAEPSGCTLAELLRECFFGVGAVYRRSVFDAVGGFREDLYAEDYLFWLLALAHGFRHRYLSRPLAIHRRSSTQKSADALHMRENDVRVISAVLASGLLNDDDRGAAIGSLKRLKRNVRLRRIASAVLGQSAAETLISRLRRR